VAHSLTVQTCGALEALQGIGFVHRIVEQWILVIVSVGDQVQTALADDKPKAWARLVSFALGTSTAFQVTLSPRQAIFSVEAFTCAIWLALESFWALTRCTVDTKLASIAMIDLPRASQIVHQKLAPWLAVAFSTGRNVCISIFFYPHQLPCWLKNCSQVVPCYSTTVPWRANGCHFTTAFFFFKIHVAQGLWQAIWAACLRFPTITVGLTRIHWMPYGWRLFFNYIDLVSTICSVGFSQLVICNIIQLVTLEQNQARLRCCAS